MSVWEYIATAGLAMWIGYQFGWLARERRLTEHERRAEKISERWHRP